MSSNVKFTPRSLFDSYLVDGAAALRVLCINDALVNCKIHEAGVLGQQRWVHIDEFPGPRPAKVPRHNAHEADEKNYVNLVRLQHLGNIRVKLLPGFGDEGSGFRV
jgi:hypothetical protein